MKEHPLIFSSEMVRAILDGRKTQTRRVPVERYRNWKVGDKIWVRETWAIKDCGCRVSLKKEIWPNGWPIKRLQYIASDKAPSKTKRGTPYWWNKRPSIHMPKWAARIFLEITGLRDERVQDISWEDAKSEGIRRDIISATGDHPNLECWVTIPDDNHAYRTPMAAFKKLWNSINAKRGYGWDKNPEVKVIEFKRL